MSARKRTMAGRPLKEPQSRIGWPIRALVTAGIYRASEEIWKELGINQSEFVRLALYRLLEHYGAIDSNLRNDDGFSTLRDKGLV